jgi:hypothetical protein
MDGTFSAVPSIFDQLYSIHVKINGEFMPHLWCLLPNKQTVTYVRLFQLLKAEATKLHRQLNPNVVHIDFELAVIGALQSEFQIEPTGCLFHFSQSILRNMAGNGLQTMYNTNNPPEVRQTVRRLMAIALVPPLRIDQVFQAVKNNAPNVAGMDVMVNYVYDTYVDPANALFDRAIWNCYGTSDRTTNCCEAYHRVMNERFRHHHPDPYAFVEFLQEQEMEFERRHGQLQNGAHPKKRRPVYVLVDEALTRLRDAYFTAGIPSVARVLAYMDAVGHQLFDVKH